MAYIDKEKFRMHIIRYNHNPLKVILTDREKEKFIRMLDEVPTADVVERKKGKWKQGYCLECGYNWGKDAPISSVPNFCPNCGAKMDGKEKKDVP